MILEGSGGIYGSLRESEAPIRDVNWPLLSGGQQLLSPDDFPGRNDEYSRQSRNPLGCRLMLEHRENALELSLAGGIQFSWPRVHVHPWIQTRRYATDYNRGESGARQNTAPSAAQRARAWPPWCIGCPTDDHDLIVFVRFSLAKIRKKKEPTPLT